MKEDTKTLLGIGAAVVGAFLFLRSNGSGGDTGPTKDIPIVGGGFLGGGPWIPGFLDGNDGGIGPDLIPGDGPILGGGPLLGKSGPGGIQLPDLGTGGGLTGNPDSNIIDGGLTGNPNTNIRDKLPF